MIQKKYNQLNKTINKISKKKKMIKNRIIKQSKNKFYFNKSKVMMKEKLKKFQLEAKL